MTLPFVLDGSISNATRTFPYSPIGPVDFSGNNFVNICQKDYYYNESSTPPQLLSEVDQCSNSYGNFWTIGAVVLVVVICVVYFTKYFAERKTNG